MQMLAFTMQVKAAIVQPDFIVSIRKKLELDRSEAAELESVDCSVAC